MIWGCIGVGEGLGGDDGAGKGLGGVCGGLGGDDGFTDIVTFGA